MFSRLVLTASTERLDVIDGPALARTCAPAGGRAFQLTGILDPLDAGWGNYEIDLFHLANGRPELGLLKHYLKQRPATESFWLRYHFYWFWDDVKHYLRMGYYDEKQFRHNARLLAKAMQEYLT
jgi:hypothetical protein